MDSDISTVLSELSSCRDVSQKSRRRRLEKKNVQEASVLLGHAALAADSPISVNFEFVFGTAERCSVNALISVVCTVTIAAALSSSVISDRTVLRAAVAKLELFVMFKTAMSLIEISAVVMKSLGAAGGVFGGGSGGGNDGSEREGGGRGGDGGKGEYPPGDAGRRGASGSCGCFVGGKTGVKASDEGVGAKANDGNDGNGGGGEGNGGSRAVMGEGGSGKSGGVGLWGGWEGARGDSKGGMHGGKGVAGIRDLGAGDNNGGGDAGSVGDPGGLLGVKTALMTHRGGCFCPNCLPSSTLSSSISPATTGANAGNTDAHSPWTSTWIWSSTRYTNMCPCVALSSLSPR